MDSDQPSSNRRKVRFAPKAPARRKSKAISEPKTEVADDDAEAEQLLKHFNKLNTRKKQRPKVDNNSSVQPTFIHGPKSESTVLKSPNVTRDGSHGESSGLKLNHLDDVGGWPITSSSSDGPSEKKSSAHDSGLKIKEYIEPWDYDTYYPTTLPWRKPYSGNPDILDEVEFGEAARNLEYDENMTNPASELGLLDSNEASENTRLILLQLPQLLPGTKRSASAKGKEIVDSSTPSNSSASTPGAKGSFARASFPQRKLGWEDLPAGKVGKLLVYKSGAVKLKLGETIYDVSPGSDCTFAQDVAAINTKKKECCVVGQLSKHAVVTPDIDYLLNSDPQLSLK